MERRTQPGYEYHSCDFMDDGVYIDMNLLREYEDTGLTPEQIMELKERDTAKATIKPGNALAAYYHEPRCPNCGRELTPKICGYTMRQAIGNFGFCPWCGQKIKREGGIAIGNRHDNPELLKGE